MKKMRKYTETPNEISARLRLAKRKLGKWVHYAGMSALHTLLSYGIHALHAFRGVRVVCFSLFKKSFLSWVWKNIFQEKSFGKEKSKLKNKTRHECE